MFITFEGPEGSGKTTQIRQLVAFLRQQGHTVLQTREPGGTLIGDQVRETLHDVAHTMMASTTEILLYSASRAQIVEEVIRPKLNQGTIVVCDRFYDSTLAYQGYGRGLDLDELKSITAFATRGLKPDITFLLDIDVQHGIQRRIANNEEMNRLDLEKVEFHERVRAGYHELVSAEPERWVVIDADRSVADIQTDLQEEVSQRLLEKQNA